MIGIRKRDGLAFEVTTFRGHREGRGGQPNLRVRRRVAGADRCSETGGPLAWGVPGVDGGAGQSGTEEQEEEGGGRNPTGGRGRSRGSAVKV